MDAVTIIVMILYLALVWGLLIIAAIHLTKHPDENSGKLGTTDPDDLPQYTKV